MFLSVKVFALLRNRCSIPYRLLEEELGIKESDKKSLIIKQAIDDVNNSYCIKIATSEDDDIHVKTDCFGSAYYDFEYVTLFDL